MKIDKIVRKWQIFQREYERHDSTEDDPEQRIISKANLEIMISD